MEKTRIVIHSTQIGRFVIGKVSSQVHTATILRNYGYEGLILCGDSGMLKTMKFFNVDDPYNIELGPGWDNFCECNKFDAGEQILFRFDHFPPEVIHKSLHPDITSCLIRDFDMGEYLPCKIIKSKRQNMEMYLGKGWYSFSKSKKLKVGDKVRFTYKLEEDILYVRLQRKGKRKDN
ncbi:hypothetical protein RYX36_007276 [Vicia faba]